jgi:glycerophosphoryl diester phosphodiesterase
VTKVIAHRGASAAFRENTVEAFAGARTMGADMVELDVRRTADGALVVHHDWALSDERVIVETRTADLPPWVPSLDEALRACEPMGVNVEIKNWMGEPDYDESLAVATAVAELVGGQGLHDRVLVSSFNIDDVDRVREVDPSIPTAWLSMSISNVAEAVGRCVDHGHRVFHPHFVFVTEGLMETCREAGVTVNTWTVDDPDLMVRLAGMGVEGIVTNVPDVAVSCLGTGRRPAPATPPARPG